MSYSVKPFWGNQPVLKQTNFNPNYNLFLTLTEWFCCMNLNVRMWRVVNGNGGWGRSLVLWNRGNKGPFVVFPLCAIIHLGNMIIGLWEHLAHCPVDHYVPGELGGHSPRETKEWPHEIHNPPVTLGSIWPHSMFNVGVLSGQFDPRLSNI